ncbi:hypothetical protein RG963_06745 [Methanosarcina sp. Z-7115]|uniref:Uncharacterized protein n=1 Tax=Methanosarcina baikalica TaxID=3073890 RepID=A0ABU2D0H5_9EURY|nr:hypothetical protein [Methanosarcina sp. Z-7115]MDR7665480.1 hypothetical protein [Methanosarcina sp. Z-7115]
MPSDSDEDENERGIWKNQRIAREKARQEREEQERLAREKYEQEKGGPCDRRYSLRSN